MMGLVKEFHKRGMFRLMFLLVVPPEVGVLVFNLKSPEFMIMYLVYVFALSWESTSSYGNGLKMGKEIWKGE